jgi:predicted transcriptional regulator of viral defense system
MVTKSVTNNTKNERKGLSKTESTLLSSLSEKGRAIFTLKDVVENSGINYDNAKVIANRLVKKRWLIRLSRGKYLIVPLEAGVESKYTEHEFVIASHLTDPYYIGYWSALNFHGYTEQIPFTVFVATTNRLKRRTILDTKFWFITITEKKFFGYKKENIANSKVNISNEEKTIADCLDHPEYCGGISEATKALWNAKDEASIKKIIDYSITIGNSAILKRLGFLTELLDMKVSKDDMVKIRSNMKKGYTPLDPIEKKRGYYSTKWGLLVNVDEDRILEWRRGY